MEKFQLQILQIYSPSEYIFKLYFLNIHHTCIQSPLLNSFVAKNIFCCFQFSHYLVDYNFAVYK